ncbi:MAG: right-handed parallel beta-helix repeat-containing protein, partial [Acetobacteraceae bacterium]
MNRLIHAAVTAFAASGLMISPTPAQTVGKNPITVGPGKQYESLWPAGKASRPGDVIQVYGGGTEEFGDLQIAHDLTIESVGDKVTLLAPTKKVGGGNVAKGILVVGSAKTEPTVTIKGFVFSGAKSSSFNGSGVRYQSGNLTLIDDTFTKNEDGVLGNPFAANTGTITMRNCTFDRNGSGDGQSHNIYIGDVAQFTLENSVSAHALVGHEVKSRAFRNIITNNRIFDGNGSAAFPGNATASYSIDLPNGGDDIIRGNTIEKGPKSQATLAIHFGGPMLLNPDSRLVVQDNTIINDGSSHNVAVNNQSLDPVELIGNKLENFGDDRVLEGIGSAKGNVNASGRPLKDFVSNHFGDP